MGPQESAKEIGDVMAAALRKLRDMTIVLPEDRDVAEELARRWDVASAGMEKGAADVGVGRERISDP